MLGELSFMNEYSLEKSVMTSGQKSRFKPFSTPEGRILLCGLVLSIAYVVSMVVGYFVSPEDFQVIIGMTATSVLFGWAAGMSFGYALGYGHAVVFTINFAVEVIMVLIIYPLFVFSWRHLLVIKALDNFMKRIESAAEIHQEKIRRYGIPSLFLFVFIPFWLTGPVIGCVIGFFLGLKPWVTISVVLSGTTLACIAWAVFLKELNERVADLNPFAPVIILFAIIIFAILGYLLESRHHQNSNDKS